MVNKKRKTRKKRKKSRRKGFEVPTIEIRRKTHKRGPHTERIVT